MNADHSAWHFMAEKKNTCHQLLSQRIYKLCMGNRKYTHKTVLESDKIY